MAVRAQKDLNEFESARAVEIAHGRRQCRPFFQPTTGARRRTVGLRARVTHSLPLNSRAVSPIELERLGRMPCMARQSNVPIQPAMARPISSGESS